MVDDGNSRALLTDLFLLFSVPICLASVYLAVPEATRAELVFSTTDLRGYTLLTAAYVHESPVSFLGVVLLYGATTGYGYALSLRAGARRWFRRSFVALLLLLPVLVFGTRFALIAALAPETALTERGFGDVAAGFGGLLLVASWAYVGEEYNREYRWSVLLQQLLILVVVADTVYQGRPNLLLVGGALLILLVEDILTAREHGLLGSRRPGIIPERLFYGLLLVAQLGSVVLLHPADVRLGWHFVTTFADTAGIWYGFVLGAVAWVTTPDG